MPVNRAAAWRLLLAVLLAMAGGALAAADLPAAKSDRVIAIGDIHGDLDALLGLLSHLRLVDGERRWTGGDATLVQTGDYLDRGAQVRELLDFLMALEGNAAGGGGRAIVLMGNHEAMNLTGELRDVSAAALAAFADAESESRREAAYAAHVKLAEARRELLVRGDPAFTIPKVYLAPEREAWMAAHPPGFLEYLAAFGPDEAYGKWLRTRDVVVRVGDTVFVHGGISPEFAPKKLVDLNERVRKEIGRWDRMRKAMIDRRVALPSFTFEELFQAGASELARVAGEARRHGERLDPPEPEAAARAVAAHPLSELQTIGKWAITDPNGPLWFRGFATWRSDEGAPRLDELQRRYGPVRFVVGHTMTSGFRVMPRFSARVFLIDTGMMSSYYQGGRASALEITHGVYAAVTMENRQVLFDPMATMTR